MNNNTACSTQALGTRQHTATMSVRPPFSHKHFSGPSCGTKSTGIGSLGELVAFVNVIVTMSPVLKPGVSGGGLEATADSTPGQLHQRQTSSHGITSRRHANNAIIQSAVQCRDCCRTSRCRALKMNTILQTHWCCLRQSSLSDTRGMPGRPIACHQPSDC
jgi:hypothetical protein